MTVLSARWLFPGEGPPLPEAEVEVREGRILEVRTGVRSARRSPSGTCLIPGLVNAHTHLEFSHLPAPLAPLRPFSGWIRSVVETRQHPRPPQEERLRAGAEESARTGTKLLGDIITSDPFEAPAAGSSVPRIIPFREVLGLRQAEVADRLRTAEQFLDRQAASGAESGGYGLSPHAPYSLHPDLFAGLCELAAGKNVPVMMHLAESPAELELLRRGDGELVKLFSQWGLWDPREQPAGRRPLDFLRALAPLPRVLLAHGTLLDEAERDFVAAHPGMSVIYCPRTHAAMQSGPHPWRDLLRRGVRVALGTDSRATNPDLSLWEELRFLHSRHPDLPASDLLALGTVAGADALGQPDAGRITPGARAELLLVQLPDGESDPQRGLLQGTLRVGVEGDESSVQ